MTGDGGIIWDIDITITNNVVTTRNIETGQTIEEFRYDNKLFCIKVIEQTLFVGERDMITVWDSQANKLTKFII